METEIKSSEVEPEVIVIPRIRSSSLKFTILYALAENETLWAEDLAEMTGKKLSQIHSAALSLKKDGLVNKFRKYIMITQAGEWYIKEYEVLAKTMWKK
jgi:predicted transcriptional regulator